MVKDLVAYIENNGEEFWDETGRNSNEIKDTTHYLGENEIQLPYHDKVKLDLYNAKIEGHVFLGLNGAIISD